MKKSQNAAETFRRCQLECQSRCCRYLTLVLPPPKRKWDFDELSWFLAHEGISVYVESRRWHLEVRNPCRHLGPDHLCTIYENRPQVCRDYETESCEYPQRPQHALHFDTREEFETWMASRREARRRARS